MRLLREQPTAKKQPKEDLSNDPPDDDTEGMPASYAAEWQEERKKAKGVE
jgi:hypothetical protein